MKILKPKTDTLLKLVTFVPAEAKELVLEALYQAGAGQLGHYKNCSFQLLGEGTFTPDEEATPYIGKAHVSEKVNEVRLELLLAAHLKREVLQALRKSHPYEEAAYYLSALENENQEVGAGMIGELDRPMDALQFLKRIKNLMQTNCIRHTAVIPKPVQRIAWCGGAGSFLLGEAKAQGADVLITADFKYHEFFDADGEIIIADIGHHESEQFTKDLLIDVLKEKFTTFAIIFSKTVTNPISYL